MPLAWTAFWWLLCSFCVFIAMSAFISGFGLAALALILVASIGIFPLKIGVEEMIEKELKNGKRPD